MRVLLINGVCGVGSTGRICTDLAAQFEADGCEVKIAYGRETVPESCQKYAVKIGKKTDFYWHVLVSKLLDAHGLASVIATAKFLKWADAYHPDLLWLHNLHGYYLNYRMLFRWIKSRPDMEVRWTLHDCWAFTGRCSYFTMAGCDKWKTGCGGCPQKKKYPETLFLDNSKRNYRLKQKAFRGVEHMTIVTPSRWLADQVRQSFLGEYPVEVQYNTIDTTVFHPTDSDFRNRYGLEKQHIILGVASPWDERKGLADFLRLSAMLPNDCSVVLVGLSASQIADLPAGVIGIRRTDSARQLAEIYTAADVFVNPTYEDNFPTTNLEAAACGTPVITYNTGGSPESVAPENVVPCGDVDGVLRRIKEILSENTNAE